MVLNDQIKKEIKEHFTILKDKVRLIVFTQKIECQFCEENRKLVEEIGALSDKISVEVYNFITDKNKSEEYRIDKIPAIAVIGTKDYNIRLYGIPSGYEFVSLIEAIRTVSTTEHRLSAETQKRMKAVKNAVHIQVFVTPTCPYCPQAVILAHRLACYHERVRSDMVEVTEFPHLANKYGVMGVPRSVINEDLYIEGAVPEKVFVDKVLESY